MSGFLILVPALETIFSSVSFPSPISEGWFLLYIIIFCYVWFLSLKIMLFLMINRKEVDWIRGEVMGNWEEQKKGKL